jgi:hypothetical protein
VSAYDEENDSHDMCWRKRDLGHFYILSWPSIDSCI